MIKYSTNPKVIRGKDFKAKNGTKFSKVLHPTLIQHGFQYKLGINEDVQDFYPEGNCNSGGLYFTLPQYTHMYTFCGGKYFVIYNISIPDDAYVYLESDTKFKTNVLYLIE